MENLKERVEKIEQRNKLVEIDKAWEGSWTRRLLLAAFTYIAISSYLWAINVSSPWLNAIVPTVGFLISTLTMPCFKEWWSRGIKT